MICAHAKNAARTGRKKNNDLRYGQRFDYADMEEGLKNQKQNENIPLEETINIFISKVSLRAQELF
jgi:hypothetical protein